MVCLKPAIAAALIAISAGAATAKPAEALNELNMRSGPGPQYRTIISMPRGANARVWNCDGAWCQVSWNGYSGYASERYLDITRYAPSVARASTPAVTYFAPEAAPAVSVPPGYNDYAYAPQYRQSYVEPSPLPNPLDFPLLPWNW